MEEPLGEWVGCGSEKLMLITQYSLAEAIGWAAGPSRMQWDELQTTCPGNQQTGRMFQAVDKQEPECMGLGRVLFPGEIHHVRTSK